jgi:cytochrome c553
MTSANVRASAIASGLLALALCAVSVRPCSADTLEQRFPMCLACHGENGTSITPEVPSLGGQPALYLQIQLYLFREKMRPIEIMNDAMRGIADKDLEVLVNRLMQLPPPAAPIAEGDAARIERGRALISKHHCNFCHQADLFGSGNVPRIADQREDYLVKALRDYKSNTRPGYDASMADVVQPLTDEEIQDLAYVASRQK